MAIYTTEVRTICESTAGLDFPAGYRAIDSILSPEVVAKIMPQNYPIFDEDYRYVLNKNILKHFYTREIGEETVGLWQLRIEQTLDEIMPYYNQLYKSELESIKPFFNVDLTTERSERGSKISNGSASDSYSKNNTGTSNIDYGEKGVDTKSKDKTGKNTTGFKAGNTHTWETGGEAAHDWGTQNINGSNTKSEKVQKNEKDVKGGTKNTTGTNSTVNRYSDTPQGGLNGLQAIEGNLYLTNATLDDASEHQLTNTSENETFKATNTLTGSDTNKNQTKTDANSQKSHNWDRRTEQSVADNTEYNFGEHYSENSTHNIQDGFKDRTDNLHESKSGQRSYSDDINSTASYLEHVSGYKGNKTYAELLLEWRKTFINIDQMIMRELETCFMLLW